MLDTTKVLTNEMVSNPVIPWCQQVPEQVTTTATGASSSSERSVAVNAGGVQENPQTKTDGEQDIRRFDDPAQSFQPKNPEEQEFYTMVLRSIFGKIVKPPQTFAIFHSKKRSGATAPATADGLRFCLSNDHEDCQPTRANTDRIQSGI